MFGSRAFVGDDVTELIARPDAAGRMVAEAMRERGFPAERISEARSIGEVGSYLELHIEQGPVLYEADLDIGVVQAIVGLVRLDVVFSGAPNHAGTTPMTKRRDALVAAARAITTIRDRASSGKDFAATGAAEEASPGSYNVIAGSARISVDVRAADPRMLAWAVELLQADLQAIAVEESTPVTVREVHRLEPTPFDPALVDVVEAVARAVDASSTRMVSGAGHDAMIIARHVPSAMVFVPSIGGISHSPEERTSDAACELGACVLA